MKRLLAAASVMLVTCTVTFAQDAVEKTLMDLERQWVKASMEGKGDALAPLLASDVVLVQSDGTVQTKAEYVGAIGKGKWQVNEVSDMKVHVRGNTAIVVGVWTGKGTDGRGKAVDGKERFVDTWIKMPDGKWQCVASASTAMK